MAPQHQAAPNTKQAPSGRTSAQPAIAGQERREDELGPLRMPTVSASASDGASATPVPRLHRMLHGLAAVGETMVDSAAPTVMQSPIAALFALAIVLSASVATAPVNSPIALTIAAGMMLAATVIAVVISRRAARAQVQNLIVVLDFLAIETLRFSTGVSVSIVDALVVLPALWLARTPGRRYIGYTCICIALVFLLPILVKPLTGGPTASADPDGLLRGLFTVLTYAVAATVVNHLSSGGRRRLDVIVAREQAIAREIDLGGQVQRALLPKGVSPVDGYEVAGICIPARTVGGDFYDWYPIPGGLGFTLGDVMGKGVGAGMIAATAHSVVRSTRGDDDPIAALRRADKVLSTELVEVGSFTTMFHARLRAEDGLLRYGDAGHGLTVLVRADGTWERLSSTDLPLGLGVGGQWDCHEIVLEPGAMVVSFSDGVLDLYDGSLDAVGRVGALAAAATSAAGLVDSLSMIARQTTNPDDVTIVALRRKPVS